MTKEELLLRIAGKTGQTKKDVENFLNGYVETCGEALRAGDEITLRGYGTLKTVDKAARKGRNPKTGKEIMIPAGKKVKFTPSARLLGGK